MSTYAKADFKAYKGISATTWDAQLDVIIPGVLAQVSTYTGRTLSSGTLTEKYDGTDSPNLSLRSYPITSITSVTITTPQGTSATVASTRYGVNLLNGVLKFDPPRTGRNSDAMWNGSPGSGYGYPVDVWADMCVFPRGEQNVTVVYTVAMDSPPADLLLALNQWTDYMLSVALIGVGDANLKSERYDLYTYERFAYAGGNLALFQALFGPFRRLIG